MNKKTFIFQVVIIIVVVLLSQSLISFASLADTKTSQDYITDGNKLYNQKNYSGALSAYENAAKSDSNNGYAYWNEGYALDQLERYDEAVLAYEKAITLLKNVEDINDLYLNYVYSLENIGRYREALSVVDEVINSGKNIGNAYFHKGYELGQLGRYQEEINYYNIEMKNNGAKADKVSIYNNIGYNYYKMGDYNKALSYIEKAIQLDNKYSAAYYNKARVLLKLNKKDEAIKVLSSRPDAENDPVQLNMSNANWLKDEGYYSYAIEICDTILKKDPNNITALNEKALTLCYFGKYGEGLQILDNAISIKSDSFDSYLYKGFEFQMLGEYENAISEYKKAIEIDPKDSNPYDNEGRCLLFEGKFEEAITAFNKEISIDPNTDGTYKALAYMKLNQKDKAISTLEAVPSMPKKEIWKKIAIADFMKNWAYYDDAMSFYNQALKIDPNSFDALNGKADTLKRLGLYSDSINLYTGLENSNKNDDLPLAGIVRNYIIQGKYKDAIKNCDKLIALNPYNPGYFQFKYKSFWNLGNYEEALKAEEDAIKLDDHYVDAYEYKYRTLYSMGKYNDAVNVCDYVLNNIDGSSKFALVTKGLALEKSGKSESGRECIKKALERPTQFTGLEIYNKACLYVLSGDSKNALKFLHEAISKDIQCKFYARTDKDFESLKYNIDFVNLVGGFPKVRFILTVVAVAIVIILFTIMSIYLVRRIKKARTTIKE